MNTLKLVAWWIVILFAIDAGLMALTGFSVVGLVPQIVRIVAIIAGIAAVYLLVTDLIVIKGKKK